MQHTPLSAAAPRVLVHVRGTLDAGAMRFWERLRHALRERGLELMLTAHYWPEHPAGVPVLRARNGFAAVRDIPLDRGWTGWLPETAGFDPAPYLEAERMWNGPPEDAAAERRRLEAARFFWRFYGAALHTARPVMTLIWNGHHPQEMILRDRCRACGCPVHFIERAPVHGAIQLDPGGILGGTAIARSTGWAWNSVEEQRTWRHVAAEVAGRCVSSGQTWWEQPQSQGTAGLRRRLGIREGQQVLLFAGQVDRDTQNLLYSPHFGSTLEAFQWLCQRIPEDGSVYVLGKHHPMSNAAPEVYQAALGHRGTWTADLALEDALGLADRVAAVNSTLLCEALMRAKPVLMLGQGLLSGKGIAYAVTNPSGDEAAIHAWLQAADFTERQERWQDFLAYLLAHCFFTMLPPEESGGQRGAAELAGYIAAHAAAPEATDYTEVHPRHGFVDEVSLWDDWMERHKEHQGCKEVLRGFNIAARATLGRLSPRAYATLKHFADRAYARHGQSQAKQTKLENR